MAATRAPREPLEDAHGGKLEVSIFRPASVEGGLLLSSDFELREGYRVWRGADMPDEYDLEGTVAYGPAPQLEGFAPHRSAF